MTPHVYWLLVPVVIVFIALMVLLGLYLKRQPQIHVTVTASPTEPEPEPEPEPVPEPEPQPVEEDPVLLSASGNTTVRIMGTTASNTVTFPAIFSEPPTTQSITVENKAFLGTPEVTANLVVIDALSGNAQVTLSNFPQALPANRQVVLVGGTSGSAGCYLDSLGEVWMSYRKHSVDTDAQFVKTTDGLLATTFTSATDTSSGSSNTARSFWLETAEGNMLHFVSYEGGQFFGYYGPVSGNTLPSSISGLPSGVVIVAEAVARPGDPTKIYIPYAPNPFAATQIVSSSDSGKTFGSPTQLSTNLSNFPPLMAFYDDDNAIIVYANTSRNIQVIHFDGSTYTDRGTIAGSNCVNAAVLVVSGVVAVVSVNYSASDVPVNGKIRFATNNDGSAGWSAPTDIGAVTLSGNSVDEFRAGVTNGVPWVVAYESTQIIGKWNDQSDAKGTWSSLETICNSFSTDASNMGLHFASTGLAVCSVASTHLVFNYVPSMATLNWEVQGT